MKHSLTWLCLFFGMLLSLCGAEPGVLFEANFDQFSANAAFGKGGVTCRSFANPDLQLRMFPGVGGKGNAINLENSEFCEYPAIGNFNSKQGTVTIWLAPQNWKPSEKKVQVFFDAVIHSGFRLIVYKNQYANCFYALIMFPGAPGTEKNFQATSFLPDADWPAGKWHRLDVTWDSETLKLYVDGLQTRRERWHISTKKFPARMDFPMPDDERDFIAVGTSKSWNGSADVDRHHRTAFDLVRVWDRPLSAAEIKADYERTVPSQFGKVRRKNRLTIPLTADPARATVVPINNLMEGSEAKCAPADAKAALYCDENYLHLDADIAYSPRPARIAARDGELWLDDVLEFHLVSTAGTVYQFIVNGKGAVYDAKNGNPAWNPAIKCQADVRDGMWQIRLAIPRKDLDEITPNAVWQGGIFLSLMTPRGAYCRQAWFDGGAKMFAEPVNRGEFIFGDEAFQLAMPGDLGNGDFVFELKRTGSEPVKTHAYILAENGVRTDFAGDLFKTGWATPLPAGKYQLAVTVSRGGNKLFLYEKFFTVNKPLELKFTSYPSRKFVEVSVDFSNAGADNLKKLGGAGIEGSVKLMRDGKTISEVPITAKALKTIVKLPLPNAPEAGTCVIAGEFGSLRNSVNFRVPDMTPYRLKIADDHTVPRPWVPIRDKGDLSFDLLDRTYVFGNSPAPVQVVSRSENMLISPPVWAVNGQAVQWSKVEIAAKHPDVVKLTGTGHAPGLKFTWRGELNFDGVYKLTLDMTPEAGRTRIDSFRMSYQVPAAHARYFLSPTLLPWRDDRIDVRYEILHANSNRDFFLWNTGIEKGFLWWPKSNANFVNAPGEKQISVVRRKETVTVDVRFISQSAELTKTAQYVSAFLGTPVKPLPLKSRAENISGWGRTAHQTLQPMGWGVFEPGEHAEDCTSAAGMKLAHPDRFQSALDRWHKVNVRPFLYGMPAQIATNDPEYDYFYAEWAKTPTYTHSVTKRGVKIINEPMCGHTKVADLGAYRADQLFRQFKDLSGLYFDLSDVRFCENPLHGCGGIDAFGRPYLSSIALNLREFMKRIYKVSRRYDREIIMHAHNLFNPIAHSFNDYWYPGEQTFAPLARNIEHYYCEGISPEEFQSEYSSEIKGIPVVFLPQYARVSHRGIGFPHLKSRHAELYGPEYAIRTITPMIVHDVNVAAEQIHWGTTGKLWTIRHDLDLGAAEFRGYWFDDAVKTSDPRVYASYYILKGKTPYKRFIIVSNFARGPKPAGLKIDWDKFGLGPDAEFVGLWDQKPLTAEELQTKTIPGNHFLLIGVKPGK
ncbi:MAG: DUF6067 family protein [Lentisphaeria bacterium]|nr:DUF6067 family protein [Lentisphaeria bacterium]